MDKLTLLDTYAIKLPEAYQQAKVALNQCVKIDECKKWADKAEALYAYARMADDDELEKMCMRIRARAIRRVGELLKEFDAPGLRTDLPSIPTDTRFPQSQKQAAEQAGLSKNQQVDAVRVANIPEERFEQITESDNPLSINKLAELGKKLQTDRPGFNEAIHTLGALRRFADKCKTHDPELIINGILSIEIEEIKELVQFVQQWLESFNNKLTKGD